MKKIYFLTVALCFFVVGNAQIINFPDANFKAKLLAADSNTYIARNLIGNYFKIDSNDNGEIEVSETVQVSALNINSSFISNLTGISYFTNIEDLMCENNQLNSLDVTNLNNLKYLSCSGNTITTLNVFNLPNLITIRCYSNQLSEINLTGLSGLELLSCESNQLISIDLSDLTALKRFECEENLLTNLDISNLNALDKVYCSYNQLTNLNLVNCPSLTFLDCQHNQLTNFAFLGLNSLISLNCSNNQFTSLDVSSLNALVVLECNNNNLTELNLASNLRSLNCTNNQLSVLDVDGLDLGYLYCTNNQLSNLSLGEMPNLVNLSCSNNPILNLNLDESIILEFILCNNTSINSLDLSKSSNLYEVSLNNNSLLTSLNLKNGKQEKSLSFSSNPNLIYICTDDIETSMVQILVSQYGYSCNLNSYCSFTSGGKFYTIQGNNKYDTNINGCDALDTSLANLKYTITDGTNTGSLISNTTGNYSIPVQVGIHTITPVLENPTYFTVSPTNVIVDFPTQVSPYTQDFCVTANGIHPDLEISLLPINAARPGFDATYKIIYKNKGNTTQSGTVNLAFDDLILDFVFAIPATASQSSNNFSWNFTNLLQFETREIILTLNVNSPMETPAVNGGDVLNYTTTITSSAIDDLPNDNTFVFNQTVVNSFDPNDKTCLQGATISPEKIGDYVHYMIRFENTGTFPAENIVVKDMIDTAKFDVNSLIPVKGSHSFVTNISSGNKVEFIFENINLPFDDANNDGYVAFKIKTRPTLANGDTFSNTASIYFDYNFPIVTNVATTTIQTLSRQDFEFSSYFNIYPNPVSDVLSIIQKESITVSSVNIYNTLGQLVLVIPNAKNTKTIDVSSLTTGNYFIKINSDKGNSNTKFIKK